MLVLSTGMAMAMSPATNSIMGSIPVRRAGVGSAMNNTARQVGGALGVAVLGTLMNNVYVNKINDFVNTIPGGLSDQALQNIRGGIQTAHIVAQHIANPVVSKGIVTASSNAFVSGMRESLLVGSVIVAVAALATLIILPSKVQPPIDDTLQPKARSN
jgi:hypothetical protein